MPTPKTDSVLGPEVTGSPTDGAILGFWWSEYDWQWYPVTLGEIRESVGNDALPINDARTYASEVLGLNLRLSIPNGAGRPSDESYRYDASGRDEAPRGRGSGGGGASQTYVPPDEAAVAEQVKAYVVAVTGTNNPSIVEAAVAEFMSADKKAFESRDTTDIDPWTAMQAYVDATPEFKQIHQLRPESVDKMDWVTQPQAKLRQLGVSAARAEELGISQAQAGATDADLVRAAQMNEVSSQKQLLSSQRDTLKSKVGAVARMIR